MHRYTKQAFEQVEAARSAADDGPRGPERLLLELLRDPLSLAVLLLLRAGVDVDQLRREVQAAPRSDPDRATDRLYEVLKLAAAEAADIYAPQLEAERHTPEIARLGHLTVGTEYLLLGIAREEGGTAAAILNSAGADLVCLRQNLLPAPRATSLPVRTEYPRPTSSLQYEKAGRSVADRMPLSIRRRRFTEEARYVLLFALDLAAKMGCEQMRPDHFLMALAAAPPTAGSRLLQRMKVDLAQLQERASGKWGPEPATPVEADTIRLDCNLKAAVDRAYGAARGPMEGPIIMDTVHILYGVLCHPGPEAFQILTDLGLDIQAARCALQTLLEVS